MDKNTILIIIIGFGVLFLLAIIAYVLLSRKKSDSFEKLMKVNRPQNTGRSTNKFSSSAFKKAATNANEIEEDEIAEFNQTKRKEYKKSKVKINQEDRLFHAGYLTKEAREGFNRNRIILPILAGFVLALLGFFVGGALIGLLAAVIGLIGGYLFPSFYIDYKKKRRGEEIMYYLPLVIEQVAIGVSSSLDIGPCLQRVVQMADERDSHNVVTELIFNVERYIRSGVGLEEALVEIGNKSGHVELKHAFMALSQVAKHGGEISSQLQELANAVTSQRETMIDGQIKKLELKATGPVALVFLGFIVTLLVGIFIRIQDAF